MPSLRLLCLLVCCTCAAAGRDLLAAKASPSPKVTVPSSPSPQPAPSPSPRPASPSPKPASPSPKPASPSPKPASPSPKPASPSPKPASPSPAPASPSPKLASPSPTLASPSPKLASPSPTLASPSPKLASPSPTLASPSPKLASPSPVPVVASPSPSLEPSPSPAVSSYAFGIEGGWTVRTDATVAGARHINPINTDKDGAIVAARVASALGALGQAATSDSRRSWLDPTRMADASYVNEAADYVVNGLYGRVAQAGANPLLRKDTLVLSSVHRYGLYLAEALHARVLPLQFISFASTWQQAVDASASATIIAGQDGGYGGLWLWNKLAAGAPGSPQAALPPAYVTALQEATNVVVVQPCDNWVFCDPATDPSGSQCWDAVNATYLGGSTPIYLHTSLSRSGFGTGASLFSAARSAGLIGKASYADVGNLKQWEWGVPDSTVSNLKTLWASLGKPADNLQVASSGVVDMLFTGVPDLWRLYLDANAVPVRGFHWNSYWVAHTQLERAAGVLPFASYAYYHPGWAPVDDKARAVMAGIKAAAGTADLAALAPNSRAFSNTIGSASDITATAAAMSDFGLTAANGAFFSSGVDCSDITQFDSWPNSGQKVPAAHITAAIAVQNATLAPYTPAAKAWAPLSLTSLAALNLPSVCYRPVR